MKGVSLIVAMSIPRRIIGFEGDIPWHLSADLKRFKSLTMGKPIIMGRKTWESIGKPLPGRISIVMSRTEFDPGFPEVHVRKDLLETLDEFSSQYEETMVVGGASIYEQAFPYVEKLYLTGVYGSFSGDTFFPDFSIQDWEMLPTVQGPENEEFPYFFTDLIRR